MMCHLDHQITCGTGLERLQCDHPEHRQCLEAVLVAKVPFWPTVRESKSSQKGCDPGPDTQVLWHLDQQVTEGIDLVRLGTEYPEHGDRLLLVLVAKVPFRSTVREYPDLLGKAMLLDQTPRCSAIWTSK